MSKVRKISQAKDVSSWEKAGTSSANTGRIIVSRASTGAIYHKFSKNSCIEALDRIFVDAENRLIYEHEFQCVCINS